MAELPVCLSCFAEVLKMISLLLVTFSVFWTVSLSSISPDDPTATYDILYNAGVEAYSAERWFECMTYMERSTQDYQFYEDNLLACRLKCQKRSYEQLTESKSDVDDVANLELDFFEITVKKSDCLRDCKGQRFKGRLDIFAPDVEEAFKNYIPYDYLQMCAYKVGRYEEAVAAAYTFLVHNPDHEKMRNNVAYYETMKEVKPYYFKNLLARPHQEWYLKGADAYVEEDYLATVAYIESALKDYYPEYNRCQLRCEGPYDPEILSDFYNAVADHYIEVLRCQMECSSKVATINGVVYDDYLTEHYNYLQFAYYKVNEWQKAIECAATFLMMKPGDKNMLSNKQFYLNHQGISESFFKPRPEAVAHQNKLDKQTKIWKFALTEYNVGDADDDIRNEDPGLPEIVVSAGKEYNPGPYKMNVFGPRDEALKKDLKEEQRKRGVEIVAENETLKGRNRLAVDGFLTDKQCQELVQLADNAAVTGDGYTMRGKSSPHTEYEKFEGLTVDKAAELVTQGKVKSSSAHLYLRASEMGRSFLEKYYNLNNPLYFHFTHLVCRTALNKQNQSERNDLSHPVHSDNCFIEKNGSCRKEKPAYIWRDFTGLIYLNDDFEGGNFFFAHKNQSVQHKLRPKCGRLVGFISSDYHGVQAVTKGRRCALAMWYTLNHLEQELAHSQAHTLLTFIERRNRSLENPELEKNIEKNGFQVVLTEAELNGPERFLAEGVATQKQCETLMKLARTNAPGGENYYIGAKGRVSPHSWCEIYTDLALHNAAKTGVQGDGYDKEKFSHTKHEAFQGLTIKRAMQLATDGFVNREGLKLLLELSEKSLEIVRQYFRLKNLYFEFTHLVCRQALNDDNVGRTDLSHPIHGDNCLLQPDGSCKKQSPAYIQRDYSAILYLNEDFLGGDFIFVNHNMTIQSTVRPMSGRLVGFNASNLHGVKAVLNGHRCALAMWFTLDPKHKEEAREAAWTILKKLEKKPVGPGNRMHSEL